MSSVTEQQSKYDIPEYLLSPTWEAAATQVVSILQTDSGRRIKRTLPAIRRVGALYSTKDLTALRVNDVCRDINQFEGRRVPYESVQDTINSLDAICFTFDPVIEDRIKHIGGRFRRLDPYDITLTLQNELRRQIIFNWAAKGETEYETAETLTHYLTKLSSILLRKLEAKDRGSYIVEDETGERNLPGSVVTIERLAERPQLPIKRIIQVYRDAVSDLNLYQLMSIIDELDWRKKIAVLKMGKYFHPEESLQQHYRRLGQDRMNIQSELRHALSILTQRSNQGDIGSNTPIDILQMVVDADEAITNRLQHKRKNLSNIVEYLSPEEQDSERPVKYKPGKYRTNEWFVTNTSSRAQLADLWDTIKDPLLAVLTDTEQQIVRLAMVILNNKFMYTYEEIGEKCGFSEGWVRNVVYHANKIRIGNFSREAIKRERPRVLKMVPVLPEPEPENKSAYRTRTQTIPEDSPRVQLILSNAANNLELIQRLNRTEAIVLQYAVAYSKEGYLLSNKEIAAEALIVPEVVPVVLAKINNKRISDHNSIIDQEGIAIDPKGVLHKLIAAKDQVPRERIGLLDDKERSVYELVVFQDEQGHYYSTKKLREITGLSRIDIVLKRIYAKLIEGNKNATI